MSSRVKSITVMCVVGLSFLFSRGLVNAEADPAVREELKHFIEALSVGRAHSFENLAVFPVHRLGKGLSLERVATLEEALRKKWLVIREKEGGTVPFLLITNRSNRYVYIMGGEILSGGKQDRIVGRDVIIGPRRRNLSVPVFCVEQGRWNVKTDRFYSNKNLGTPKLRSQAQAGKDSSQSNIWREIGETNRKLGVSSDTEAYQDVYTDEELSDKIEKAEEELMAMPELYDDVTGVVVAVGEEIVSVDIFATSALFKAMWPKILKSSALIAAAGEGKAQLTRVEAADFLQSFLQRRFVTRPAVDQGEELYFEDAELSIGAIVFNGAIVHLAAFPLEPVTMGSVDREIRQYRN
jgi:hypothetical protein